MREPPATPPDTPTPKMSAQRGDRLPAIDARPSGEHAWAPEPLPGADHDLPARRSFNSKMFGIGAWGWMKLAILCVVVGVLFQLAQVDPFEPGFTVAGALTSLAQSVANLLGWSIANGWRPAILGAIVVLPVWAVWRLLSVPFRK